MVLRVLDVGDPHTDEAEDDDDDDDDDGDDDGDCGGDDDGDDDGVLMYVGYVRWYAKVWQTRDSTEGTDEYDSMITGMMVTIKI